VSCTTKGGAGVRIPPYTVCSLTGWSSVSQAGLAAITSTGKPYPSLWASTTLVARAYATKAASGGGAGPGKGGAGSPAAIASPAADADAGSDRTRPTPLKLRSPVPRWQAKHVPSARPIFLRPRGLPDLQDGASDSDAKSPLGWQVQIPLGAASLLHRGMSATLGENAHLRCEGAACEARGEVCDEAWSPGWRCGQQS
jgi:hypothetical protein